MTLCNTQCDTTVCVLTYSCEIFIISSPLFIIKKKTRKLFLQAVFSSVFYFASVALYQGFLMVGYATVYTMFPVFSLVLDKDVTPETALTYPELYKEMGKGRSLSYKTFFIWVLVSIYQGECKSLPACLELTQYIRIMKSYSFLFDRIQYSSMLHCSTPLLMSDLWLFLQAQL